MPLYTHDTPTSVTSPLYDGCFHPYVSTHAMHGAWEGDRGIRVLMLCADRAASSLVREQVRLYDDVAFFIEDRAGDIALLLAMYRPDAVVVDVDSMENGEEAFAQFGRSTPKPMLLFMTDNASSAVRAFELGAADYLLKPVRAERIDTALGRVREHVAHRGTAWTADSAAARTPVPFDLDVRVSTRIAVTSRGRTQLIEPAKIEWIGAAGDYAELHVGGATHLLREPLSALLGRLPDGAFCRIHRSAVVNLAKVAGMKTLRNQDLLVKLSDRTVLRASRTFSGAFRKAVKHYGGARLAAGAGRRVES